MSEITDAIVVKAWQAYAETHFRLKNSIPTDLEKLGMRAALEAVVTEKGTMSEKVDKPVAEMTVDELYTHGMIHREWSCQGIPADAARHMLERWVSDLVTYQGLPEEKAVELRQRLFGTHEDISVRDFWANHPDPTGYDSRYDPLG